MNISEASLLRLARVALVAAWAAVIGYELLASLPEHPNRLSAGARRGILAITPQGWAFFTRDPREAVDFVYAWRGKHWVSLARPNASPSLWFGLDKTPRYEALEIGPLVKQIAAKAWVGCEAGLAACVRDSTFVVTRVDNHSALQSVCGRYLIERKPPVPWAWSRSASRVYMPAQLAMLEVSCDIV